jgi:hypothetical protein
VKFTKEECESLNVLLKNPEFTRVMGGIARFTEEHNKVLVMKDLPSGELLRMQGQTRGLVMLMDAIGDAPERLQQFNQADTHPKG